MARRLQKGRTLPLNMKTSLKLIALLVAAGYSMAAFADLANINVPSINPESAMTLFVTAVLGLLFVGDYSQRARSLTSRRAPVIVPPASAFVTKCAAKSECLAA
ncbi:MAG: hypothetical protein JWM88_1380 [Verrucomicrobia bacterium]|nr:hypothetical protein [Verrucomicrobiota bacterium]